MSRNEKGSPVTSGANDLHASVEAVPGFSRDRAWRLSRRECLSLMAASATLAACGGSVSDPDPGGDGGGGGSGTGYVWYPSLNLNDVPFHTAAGAWGDREVVQTAAAPATSTQTSVSTWAAFESACLTPGTEITVTASIDGTGNPVSGSLEDIDIIVNPGVIITSPIFGRFGQGDTVTRLRIRGPTVGEHSGGQIHNTVVFGTSSDVIFDGIDMSGGGPSKEIGLQASTAAAGVTHTRWALINNRIHTGNAFFLGGVSHFVIAGNSAYSGADSTPMPPDDEAWVFRFANGVGPVVVYDNDLRNSRFHIIRAHPSSAATTSGYIWVNNNVLVDLTEARIFWNGRASSGHSGVWQASWFTENTIYAEDNHVLLAPDVRVANAEYTRIQNNVFHGDFHAGHITTTSVTDSDVSGNTFNASDTPPAHGGPGDPTGIDWNP